MRSGSHGITILATWGKTSFQCDLTKLAIRSPSRVTRILGCGLNGSGAYKFLEVDLASHEFRFSKHNESFTMSRARKVFQRELDFSEDEIFGVSLEIMSMST
nr:hypothetical protein Iba_chr09eCG11050 [Ipomoea batatas]